MEQLLAGLPGVIIIIDDILIHAATEVEHAKHNNRVVEVLNKHGLKLNKKKCLVKQKLVYMSHLLSNDGLEPDPEKVQAILKLSQPKNILQLRQTLGMVNYIARFLPDLSTVLKPLNDLLKANMEEQQPRASIQQDEVACNHSTSIGILWSEQAHCNFSWWKQLWPRSRSPATAGSATANCLCIQNSVWQWTALRPSGKELLATTWACKKFTKYLIGLQDFTVHTDHKPLIAKFINKQDLDKGPVHC